MSLGFQAIVDTVASHAAASGHFDQVPGHEPKNAPSNGLTCAVWAQSIAPAQSSGLASTSGLLVLNVRVYASMLSEPQDAIDPNIVAAVDALMSAYAGDFDLGSTVRCVDIRGQAGTPMSAAAGYMNIDGKLYRVMTITLPILINDCWTEAA